MLKRFLLALVLALVSSGGFSQGAAKDGSLALLYDVESTSLTYCTLAGGPFASPTPVAASITTSGSSTTVTELVASSLPFTGVAVGDVLVIQTPSATNASATTIVAVTAKASGASITVDTAITLTGNKFSFYHHVCGTTDADGWFAIPVGAQSVGLAVQYDQGDLGAFVARWECKDAGVGSAPVILYPSGASDCGALGFALASDRCSATVVGSRLKIVDTSPAHSACRVGVAYVTSDALDTTTNREKVTIKVTIR